MSKDEKLKALNLALSQIEKDFGKEAIMRLGEKNAHVDVDVIPTGALPLDIAIGIGGIPRGRIIEILGLNHQENQRLLYVWPQKPRNRAALLPILMPNMQWIRIMLQN